MLLDIWECSDVSCPDQAPTETRVRIISPFNKTFREIISYFCRKEVPIWEPEFRRVDGLSGDEGVFLACSFWLAGVYQMMGREEDARRMFERAASTSNDLGLLAEEYDPKNKRQLGNFPQAFSHFALVNAAFALSEGTPMIHG